MQKSFIFQTQAWMTAGLGAMLLAACSSDEPKSPTTFEPYVEMSLTDEELAVANSQTGVSIDMYKAADDLYGADKSNFVFSPLSATRDAAVLVNGAMGESRRRLMSALGFSGKETLAGMNTFYAKLKQHLETADSRSTVKMSSSFWGAEKPLKDFEDFVAGNYGTTFGLLTADTESNKNVINKWVEDATAGLMKDYLTQGPSGEEIKALDALYFNATWGTRPEEGGGKGRFYNHDGRTSKVNQFKFFSAHELVEDNLMAVRTYYGNGAYAITFVLPDPGYKPSDAIASLSAEKWGEWQKVFAARYNYEILDRENDLKYVNDYMFDCELIVPEWTVESKLDLRPVYEAVGLGDIFDGKTDLSGIYGPKTIFNQASQTLKFKTDVNGTVAVAVTEIGGITAVLSPIVEIDHPFAYIISESRSGVILFAGVVNQL